MRLLIAMRGTMLQHMLSVLALLSSAQAYRILPSTALPASLESAPRFCHELACPEYKLVKLYDTYEERLYSNTTWAVTEIPSIIMEPAQMQGFKRLFKYIQGANEEHEEIPMSVPVVTKVVPGDGIFSTTNFSIGFYIAEDDPPTPAVDQVYIKDLPSKTAFVLQFGGFAVSPVVACKAKSFVEQLKADGQSIVEGFFIVASYDPPFRLTRRHNEIWVLKADDAATGF